MSTGSTILKPISASSISMTSALENPDEAPKPWKQFSYHLTRLQSPDIEPEQKKFAAWAIYYGFKNEGITRQQWQDLLTVYHRESDRAIRLILFDSLSFYATRWPEAEGFVIQEIAALSASIPDDKILSGLYPGTHQKKEEQYSSTLCNAFLPLFKNHFHISWIYFCLAILLRCDDFEGLQKEEWIQVLEDWRTKVPSAGKHEKALQSALLLLQAKNPFETKRMVRERLQNIFKGDLEEFFNELNRKYQQNHLSPEELPFVRAELEDAPKVVTYLSNLFEGSVSTVFLHLYCSSFPQARFQSLLKVLTEENNLQYLVFNFPQDLYPSFKEFLAGKPSELWIKFLIEGCGLFLKMFQDIASLRRWFLSLSSFGEIVFFGPPYKNPLKGELALDAGKGVFLSLWEKMPSAKMIVFDVWEYSGMSHDSQKCGVPSLPLELEKEKSGLTRVAVVMDRVNFIDYFGPEIEEIPKSSIHDAALNFSQSVLGKKNYIDENSWRYFFQDLFLMGSDDTDSQECQNEVPSAPEQKPSPQLVPIF